MFADSGRDVTGLVWRMTGGSGDLVPATGEILDASGTESESIPATLELTVGPHVGAVRM